jgi:protein-disulfide isomerase
VRARNTNMTSRWFRVGLVLVFSWVLAAGGCKPTKKIESGKGTQAAQAGEKKEELPKGPCGEYAAALCKVVGDQSFTCKSIKDVTDLMPPSACKAGMSEVAFTKTRYEEKRKICTDLVDKLCKDIGPDTKTCGMVRDQTKNFPPERCEMFMKNYDQVLGDLKARESENKPLTKEQQDMIGGDVPTAFGPKNAKVTIVEFSDFQCPYCSQAAKTVKALKAKYSDKVRFVFRNFPLSFHKDAHLAAEAAMAAAAQGKFFEFHDVLFENQQKLARENLEEYVKKVNGLDGAKFKKALDDKAYAKVVDADVELGNKVAVRGTPTMFLNGTRVNNPTDVDALSKEIEEALKK